MEHFRIESTNGPRPAAPRKGAARVDDGSPDFEEVLREVDQDLGRLERLAEDARRVAADDGPADPEMFREAVRESEAALRSAHRIRSRLLGAYQATQGRA
jgi:flagellar hook-basal body complex protein FliE